jgi:hypothetical protein
MCWTMFTSGIEGYDTEPVESLSYSVSPDAKKRVTPETHLKKVAGMLKDEKTVKQYEEAMHVDGTEKVDPQLVRNHNSSFKPWICC